MENNVQTGRFTYQRRELVKATNLVVLVLCLVVAGLVNYVLNAPVILVVVTFFAVLVLLAIIMAPITEKYFYLEGRYTFTPDKLTFQMHKDISVNREDVKFVRCSPLKEKRGVPDRTWCLQITMKGAKEIYRIYSLDLEENNDKRVQQVKEFKEMASLLCDMEEDN